MLNSNGLVTHGEGSKLHGTTPEYRAWGNMKDRCYNLHHPAYYLYGGRGVIVCEAWLNNYIQFLTDVGRRPSPNHSIDRYPNKTGNYEPGNVRWATKYEQTHNRRKFKRDNTNVKFKR